MIGSFKKGKERLGDSNFVKGLRVVYIGDLRESQNACLRYRAMESLGANIHTVDTSCSGLSHRVAKTLQHYTQFTPSITEINHLLLNQIRLHQPHIVWVDKGLFVRASTLRRAKAISPETIFVHYNPDDPFGRYSKGFGILPWRTFISAISEYDVHFVKRIPNIKELYNHGAKRVEFFYHSFDLERHYPVELSQKDKELYKAEVGFIGTFAPARSKSIAFLVKNGVPMTIWGDKWPESPDWEMLKSCWRGPSVYGDAYAKAISGMEVALHFLRHENRDEQDSRTFEIPACGSFMLAERTSTHERVFQDGKEAVFFDSDEDLLEKVRFYLAHPLERQRIAQAGRARCVSSGYDHQSRISELFERLKMKPK